MLEGKSNDLEAVLPRTRGETNANGESIWEKQPDIEVGTDMGATSSAVLQQAAAASTAQG